MRRSHWLSSVARWRLRLVEPIGEVSRKFPLTDAMHALTSDLGSVWTQLGGNISPSGGCCFVNSIFFFGANQHLSNNCLPCSSHPQGSSNPSLVIYPICEQSTRSMTSRKSTFHGLDEAVLSSLACEESVSRHLQLYFWMR
jgi:hypothetical protein